MTTQDTIEEQPKESKIQLALKRIRSEEAARNAKVKATLAWVAKHAKTLEALDIEPEISTWNQVVDFNYLSHEKTIALMQAIKAGSWSKSYNSDTITYTTKVGSVDIRIYAGQPPPNCQIVEVEETIPSHYQPEQKVIRRKLVCVAEKTEESANSIKEGK